MQNNIAFLIYEPLKQRTGDNSFDGNKNIGAVVIMDVLKRAGHSVDFCTPETAKDFKIVLVSFTSQYDIISFYQNVALRPSWQRIKRTFKVIGGGFGLQNPTSIRNYLDYAIFGRGEKIVTNLVESILGGNVFSHPSVMNLPDLHPVSICQLENLYPFEIDIGSKKWKECFTGCPNKCKFCHFTWARKSTQKDNIYLNNSSIYMGAEEVTWDQIIKYKHKKGIGQIRSAFDGFSERLRFTYGKRISNQDIIDGINNIGDVLDRAILSVYNISNFPSENKDDCEEMYSTIKRCRPKNQVFLELHSTPFRPSLITPMAHCEVHLLPSVNDLSNSLICDSNNLRAKHSGSMESSWSHLITVVVDRATPDSDNLFHAICFAAKLQTSTSLEKMRIVEKNFDLNPYLRRYEVGEKLPAWFLSSYTKQENLETISKWMEKRILTSDIKELVVEDEN